MTPDPPPRPSSGAMIDAADLLESGPLSELNYRKGVVVRVTRQQGGLAAVEAAAAELRSVIDWLLWEAR